MSHDLELDSVEVDGRYFSATASYDVEWENDGIGSYEYWGAKGYDKGNTYAVVEDFDIDELTEHLADGSEVVVGKDDPIYKKVLARISDLVDKDAEKLEHDDYEPEPEYERDYDYD